MTPKPNSPVAVRIANKIYDNHNAPVSILARIIDRELLVVQKRWEGIHQRKIIEYDLNHEQERAAFRELSLFAVHRTRCTQICGQPCSCGFERAMSNASKYLKE